MTRMNYLAAFLLLATVAAIGCKSDQSKPPITAGYDLVPVDNYPNIYTTAGIRDYIVWNQPIIDASTEVSPMRVTVPIRSIDDKGRLRVQYRFEFMDDRGRALRSNQGWRYTVLEPRQPAQFDGNALESAAAQWKLIVRPAK